MNAVTYPVEGRESRTLWRRRLAKSLGWPDGMLAACELVERLRPSWTVVFLFAHSGPEGPRTRGLYATQDEPHATSEALVSAGTAEELLSKIAPENPLS